ncbi:MAG: 50S ribosomal protein L19 [Candidatus Paceibacterota bacterium]|jgi:large subunit ribosomal protein L19
MATKLESFNKTQTKEMPELRPGDTVKVYQKIQEKDKERVQVFEGQILARKHGKGISSTITVRKISGGVGVEKLFPLHSPVIDKIELVKRGKVRRAKLYYLREAKGRKARLKTKEIKESALSTEVGNENPKMTPEDNVS